MVNGSGQKTDGYSYNKINDPDQSNIKSYNEIPEEMDDDYGDEDGAMVFDNVKLKSGKRDHEIYEGTYYIPNDKLRLLEVPMNSSLWFQMILYYHYYFDFLYGSLLCVSGLYKLMIANIAADPLSIVSLMMTILFCITESFRLKFGSGGNINESYPDLIAFMI